MPRRRSLAVLAFMVVLAVAPSLALAAAVCAPHCCPAMQTSAARDAADEAAEDCRSAFANRSCCGETAAPVSLASPTVGGDPSLPARLHALEPVVTASLLAPERRTDAQLALRTSPLRLSVVLLI